MIQGVIAYQHISCAQVWIYNAIASILVLGAEQEFLQIHVIGKFGHSISIKLPLYESCLT
jgi:hypothetical protein